MVLKLIYYLFPPIDSFFQAAQRWRLANPCKEKFPIGFWKDISAVFFGTTRHYVQPKVEHYSHNFKWLEKKVDLSLHAQNL